jgi:ferredoxin-nitrite reductase
MTEEQKQYLQGFVSGTNLARSALGFPPFAQTLARNGTALPVPQPTAESMASGPEAIHYQAQDRFLAEGKKLLDAGDVGWVS